MAHTSHPNICQLLQVIDSPTMVYLVLEYAEMGDLFSHFSTHRMKGRGLDPSVVRKLFRQVLWAVEYCHQHAIVHRDIKIENSNH